jgi:hypothetical protein
MATVTPVPFALALVGALAAFAVWMWFLVKESRRPYHWPEPRAVVEPPPARPHLRVVHVREDPRPARKVGNTRVAVVVASFLLWSLWSTGRRDRVDPHH